jgi:hypothetical protein
MGFSLIMQVQRRGHWVDPLRAWKRYRNRRRFRAALKRWKVRGERHRAKADPECLPLYSRFDGYE